MKRRTRKPVPHAVPPVTEPPPVELPSVCTDCLSPATDLVGLGGGSAVCPECRADRAELDRAARRLVIARGLHLAGGALFWTGVVLSLLLSLAAVLLTPRDP